MIENLDVNGLKYFEEICKIPRGSGNTKGISDYLVKFATDLGLKTIQDEKFNVIVYKDGTGTSTEPVIIQSHIDMVCEKNADSNHDFLKDPIELLVKGDFITANGTTLGADNGVAVAYSMQILASNDLVHPPLEFVFTTDEETGMFGAHALDVSLFKGKTLINVDNEDEGEFVVSCAGGRRVDVFIPVNTIDVPTDFKAFTLTMNGLHGGHSGVDITKELGNSNILLARTVYEIGKNTTYYISNINGGGQDNAIPRECSLNIFVPNDFDIEKSVNEFLSVLKNEYEATDKDINLVLTSINDDKCFSLDCSKNVINAILSMPNGILHMNLAINLPETSTNLGVIKTEDGKVRLSSALRSSKPSRLQLIADKISSVAFLANAEVNLRPSYPGWDFKAESKIRGIFVDTYKEQTGKDAKVEGIHAGLECGIFADKIDGLDIISVGPTILSPHSPNERVDYKSMDRTYDLLIKVLEKLA